MLQYCVANDASPTSITITPQVFSGKVTGFSTTTPAYSSFVGLNGYIKEWPMQPQSITGSYKVVNGIVSLTN